MPEHAKNIKVWDENHIEVVEPLMPEPTPLTDEIVNALADGAVLSGQKHGAFVDVAAFTTKRVPLGDHASVIVHMARDLAEARRLLRAVEFVPRDGEYAPQGMCPVCGGVISHHPEGCDLGRYLAALEEPKS